MSDDPIQAAADVVVAEVAAAEKAAEALSDAEAAELLAKAPPLVLPPGLVMPVVCGSCGLRFAEPLHGQACPNCGKPVA